MSRPAPLNAVPRATLIRTAVLSLIGMTMLMLGVVALSQPALLPALATPSVAWPLVMVGGLLETGAMAGLVAALRAARSAP